MLNFVAMKRWAKIILFFFLAVNAMHLWAFKGESHPMEPGDKTSVIALKTEKLHSVEQPNFSDGEFSPTAQLERVQTNRISHTHPSTFKRLAHLFKSFVSGHIQAGHYKQFETSAPFYCFPVSRYYIYALRHLLI